MSYVKGWMIPGGIPRLGATLLVNLRSKLLRARAMRGVAAQAHMCWDAVRAIYLLALRERARSRLERVRGIEYLDLDDISPGKVHPCLNLALKFKTGEVLCLGRRRGVAAVRLFYEFLREHGVEPVAVVMHTRAAAVGGTHEYSPYAESFRTTFTSLLRRIAWRPRSSEPASGP